MRIAGIVLVVLGVLAALDLVLTLVLPDGRDANLPIVGNTWSPILASFFIPAGIALLVAYRKRNKPRNL